MSDNKTQLYKYYDYDGLLATLETGARLWSAPLALGEVLSSPVQIKWEYGGYQEITRACVRKQDNPHDKALGIDYQRFLDKMTKGTLQPDQFVNDLKAAFNAELRDLQAKALVCCFSQNKYHLPMWTSYADRQRGGLICFGNFGKTSSPLMEAARVNYHNERPKCKLTRAIEAKDDGYIHEVLRQSLLHKATDWQQEEEWRAIIIESPAEHLEGIAPRAAQLQAGCELLPFAKEEVTAVYLGLAMPLNRRQEITKLLEAEYPWAEVYQAAPHNQNPLLEFERVKSRQYELPLNKVKD